MIMPFKAVCHSSHFSETRDYLWRWIRRASSCFSGLEGLLHSFHVSDCEYSCRMRNPERQGLKDLKRLEMA